MINLIDTNISYMIISGSTYQNDVLLNVKLNEGLASILYAREYSIINLATYQSGNYDRAYIAISPDGNDELRLNAIHLMERFNQDFVIVKYLGESVPKKIKRDGSECVLDINIYDNKIDNLSYICNGISFSFSEKKRYHHLKDKGELKPGMVVEILNNKSWIPKKIINPDLEWQNMYMLLAKYDKLRVQLS